MVPKTSPHSGSQRTIFCYYLLHLNKVRRLRNGPHFGSCLKTSFAQNIKKWGNGGCPKIGAEKKVTLRKFDCLSEDPEAPWQPPRAPGTRNNLSNNSNNNSNSCSSCCSMLMVAFKIAYVLMRPAKTICCSLFTKVQNDICKTNRMSSLLESRDSWSDTPWAKARRIVSAKSHQCGWTTFVKWPWPCWYKWLATGNVFGVFLKATSTHSKWAQLCLNECY